MKVKIGNKIYDSCKEPIMIILDEEDKYNISNMLESDTEYCSYPEDMDYIDVKSFMVIKNNTKPKINFI